MLANNRGNVSTSWVISDSKGNTVWLVDSSDVFRYECFGTCYVAYALHLLFKEMRRSLRAKLKGIARLVCTGSHDECNKY